MTVAVVATGWIHAKPTLGPRTRPIDGIKKNKNKMKFFPRVQELATLTFSRVPTSAPVRSGRGYVSSVIPLVGAVRHEPRAPTALLRRTVDPGRVLGRVLDSYARAFRLCFPGQYRVSHEYLLVRNASCTKQIPTLLINVTKFCFFYTTRMNREDEPTFLNYFIVRHEI